MIHPLLTKYLRLRDARRGPWLRCHRRISGWRHRTGRRKRQPFTWWRERVGDGAAAGGCREVAVHTDAALTTARAGSGPRPHCPRWLWSKMWQEAAAGLLLVSAVVGGADERAAGGAARAVWGGERLGRARVARARAGSGATFCIGAATAGAAVWRRRGRAAEEGGCRRHCAPQRLALAREVMRAGAGAGAAAAQSSHGELAVFSPQRVCSNGRGLRRSPKSLR